ncbi:flagellar basal body P-ring protein FlgI [Chelatococcus daeguensis]|nr:flagellar basal body P-ring protein FlgI [Chelatococcus daeguensis]MBM3083170.1 flagellar basal body P-ring protein FlgI [Chelatococcus daeguensis]
MMRPIFAIATCVIGALLLGGPAAAATRIKDIASIQGVRDNQLIGYGLVTGLSGTGDTLRNSPFTEQSLQSMLDYMGVNVRGSNLRTRNVAAVMVTANIPAFAGVGSRIDVTVSSMGDATSLRGGTLLVTPLTGGDAQVYAVAQGPIAVSGFSAQGEAETLTQGVPTAGRIPNGALVERTVPGGLRDIGRLVLQLHNPDFRTAASIADAINAYSMRRFGRRVAGERDFRSVVLERPANVNPARFIAEIGELRVAPDTPARVVIDQRTGTVVIGADVQISTVAVTHGNLTVRVTETPMVSQPEPFSEGQTVVVPRTEVQAREQTGRVGIIEGSNLQTLVRGLNQVGLKPSDIISILQAIKTSGALQADLVVQ